MGIDGIKSRTFSDFPMSYLPYRSTRWVRLCPCSECSLWAVGGSSRRRCRGDESWEGAVRRTSSRRCPPWKALSDPRTTEQEGGPPTASSPVNTCEHQGDHFLGLLPIDSKLVPQINQIRGEKEPAFGGFLVSRNNLDLWTWKGKSPNSDKKDNGGIRLTTLAWLTFHRPSGLSL